MKLKGGQKHKIDIIEENNEVRVLQLHQYVTQVDRREKIVKYVPFRSSNLAAGHIKGQKWAINEAEGGQKHKMTILKK